jgi:archaellum component FlaC
MNGPSGIISSTFTVQAADLDVQVVNQTSPSSIQRKQTVTAGINITWPDGSAFTAADLGTSYVRVYNNGTVVDTVTLVAGDYNATSNIWTISWTAPIDAPIGIGYNFTIIAGDITGTAVFGDAANPNAGPVTNLTFNNFTVTGTNLIVPAIDTIEDAYMPGEYVIVYFNATYVDGSPVTTGTSTITMTAPDGHTTITYHPVHTAAGLWQIIVWLSDAQAQIGAWDIELAAYAVDDGAGNYGPTAARTASFTVLPANVTLSDLLWEIDLLNARLAALESNTTALAGCCSNVTDLVNTLSAAIDALEAEIDSLSSTAASQTSVNNLASTVNTLSSTVNTLQSALNSLSASAASSTEVAELSAALATLETSLASLSTTAASAAELDALSAAVDELEAAVDAISASALTQTDLDTTASDLSADIGSSNTLIIVAIVLALVAAVAAIAAVYIILKKIAG